MALKGFVREDQDKVINLDKRAVPSVDFQCSQGFLSIIMFLTFNVVRTLKLEDSSCGPSVTNVLECPNLHKSLGILMSVTSLAPLRSQI